MSELGIATASAEASGLRDASHIKRQAQQLLSDLNDSIKDAIEILGERTPWDKLSPRPASDSGSDTTDGDSDDGIPEGETEINQVMESIHDTITQLLRFSTAIQNPAPHDQHMNSAEIDTSCFESFDIDHVRNKYPDAPEDLAVTLGKAISSRRGYFKYREAHSKKLAHGTISELAPSHLPPTSGSDMITTDYVRDETLPQSTIASSLPLEVKESNNFIDLDQDQQSDSGMTQTSFASSAASFHELKEYERGVGPDALETLKENRDLGMAYRDQGKLPEAEVFCKRAAEGMEKTLSSNSDETLHSLESLSTVRTSLGDFENGLEMLNQVVEGYEKSFGAEGKPTLTALKRQSVNFSGLGNNSEAAKLLNRILKGYEKTYGPDHPETMDVVKRLARTSRALGKSSEVEPLLERALQHYDHAPDLAGPEYVSILNESARCYKSQNRLDEAEAISQRMLGVSEKKYGAQDIRTLTALLIRGRIHVQQGRLSEAEEALQRVMDSLDMNGQSGQYTDEFGPDSYTIEGGALELLSVVYGEQGKALESEIMMERALETVSNFNDVWRRKSWGKHLTGILFNMYT
ncbi:zinc finger transcription factor ace1 [Botryosphaeria dothidea]|uniref:Zinc finger transcription factor ace1 n=1 Tax=Botryosphaeria dothidea TaxID=55169 RepID=A0A8H4N415_9PEZI|nr:zinc finger transcription factor ace1 [Botryosphaeria dothidea]